MAKIGRRAFLAVAAGGLVAASQARPGPEMRVYKSPTCGCCGGWIDHLRASGFRVTVEDVANLDAHAARLRVPDAVRSCHTGVAGGYFVEGHVPAADVLRLLRERPAARGIAVPGMPLGSPGMEVGGRRERYRTLLVAANGTTSTWAQH